MASSRCFFDRAPNEAFETSLDVVRPETWEEVAASDTEEQRGAALEQLVAHLDVVETQLLKEIAVRAPVRVVPW